MILSRSLACSAILALGACAAPNVSKETGLLSDAVVALEARMGTAMKAALADERSDLVRDAAQNDDSWRFADACFRPDAPGHKASINDCVIVKTRRGDTPLPIGPATAVMRKVGVLADYTYALNLLASAETEDAIVLAYGALAQSLDQLGTATERASITDFAKRLSDQKDDVATSVRFVVERYRIHRMRQIMRDARPDVEEVISEARGLLAQPHLIDIAAPGLRSAKQELDAAAAANDAAVAAQDADMREAAFRRMEAAREALIKAYSGSLLASLSAFAVAHQGIIDRLSADPSPEEILDLLEGLQQLSTLLKG